MSIKTSVKIHVSLCKARNRMCTLWEGGDGEELRGDTDNFTECLLWARPVLDALLLIAPLMKDLL